MKYSDGAGSAENAKDIAGKIIDSLKEMYMNDSPLDKIIIAQQNAFDILLDLEHKGYDMTIYFNQVVDAMQHRNKCKNI